MQLMYRSFESFVKQLKYVKHYKHYKYVIVNLIRPNFLQSRRQHKI